MQTSVTFKNLDPSESLKSYVMEKLDRFDRFLDNPAVASVVLGVEKFRRIAEINLTSDRLNVVGKEESEDMYSAIDVVLDKLEKQVKKNKQKHRKHRSGAKGLGETELSREAVSPVDESPLPIVVKNIEYKPMGVEEAVLLMDIAPENFLVFVNSDTGDVNVLYTRNNGEYGLIQPL